MKRYREVAMALLLLGFALVMIGGFCVWLLWNTGPMPCPQEGTYVCQELDTTIDLTAGKRTITMLEGEGPYPLTVAYSGELRFRMDENDIHGHIYGYVERKLFCPEGKLYIRIAATGQTFPFIRRN